MRPPHQPRERAQKQQKPIAGIERGDHLYVQHPQRGPIAIKVLAKGRDGLTCECDQGKRHGLPWSAVLGVKARMLHAYKVVDQGAGGAIVEDDAGRRRYISYEEDPLASPPANPGPLEEPTDAPAKDDPILGGMSDMRKAMLGLLIDGKSLPEIPSLDPISGPIDALLKAHAAPIDENGADFVWGGSRAAFFIKAEGPPRAGLALRPVTDKLGHQTKRWVRSAPEEKAAPGERANDNDRNANDNPAKPRVMKHGDVVRFRHGDVEGNGKIVASGADGVTLKDEEGRQHQVRHEHLLRPGQDKPPPGVAANENAPAPAADATLFSQSEISELPNTVAQPFHDRDELFKASSEALAHLKSWLNQGKGICDRLGYQTMKRSPGDVDFSQPGGMLFIAPLKGMKRAAEKVEADYGGDWSKLRDVTRCSIAVDSMEELHKALGALKAGGMKLAMKPKDRFAKPVPGGYRDLLMNVQFPNGVIGEVQLHLKGMLEAKNEGHHYYEITRSLEGKYGPELEGASDGEKAQHQDALDKSTALYTKAWAAASGGAAEGGEMKKALEADGTDGEQYIYLDHEGAQFRRLKNQPGRSVEDVLVNGKWTPYKGDAFAVGMWGDVIPDPLGGKGEGEEQAQADADKPATAAPKAPPAQPKPAAQAPMAKGSPGWLGRFGIFFKKRGR